MRVREKAELSKSFASFYSCFMPLSGCFASLCSCSVSHFTSCFTSAVVLYLFLVVLCVFNCFASLFSCFISYFASLCRCLIDFQTRNFRSHIENDGGLHLQRCRVSVHLCIISLMWVWKKLITFTLHYITFLLRENGQHTTSACLYWDLFSLLLL